MADKLGQSGEPNMLSKRRELDALLKQKGFTEGCTVAKIGSNDIYRFTGGMNTLTGKVYVSTNFDAENATSGDSLEIDPNELELIPEN